MKQLCAALVVVMALAAYPIAQTTTDIVGNWDITTVSPLGETTGTMVVSKAGDGLKAVAKSPDGERPYDKVELTGSAVKIVLTIDFEGSPMIMSYTGKTDGKNMSGAVDFGGLAEGTWSAVRK